MNVVTRHRFWTKFETKFGTKFEIPGSRGQVSHEALRAAIACSNCIEHYKYTLDANDMLNAIPKRRDCVQALHAARRKHPVW